MGAFIGYGQRGVWANNRERDAFLDWFADHRCVRGDAAWEFCKSEGNRWTGCCIELSDLIPSDETFSATEAELERAAQDYWPDVVQLIQIIADISRGRWQYAVDSKEAVDWRESITSRESMRTKFDLTFRYEERDYLRAMRAHLLSELRLRLDILVCVIGFASGCYLWRFSELKLLGQIAVGGSVLFALLLIAAFTVLPRWWFRREPKYRDEYSLSFSPEGIHFRTAHIDSQLQWSLYTRALVDEHSFILYYGSRQFTIIPRREFANAEQQRAFANLLTQHVEQIARRP